MDKTTAKLITFLAAVAVAIIYSSCSTAKKAPQSKQETGMEAHTQGVVIEIATFRLNQGVTADEFRPLDKAVELQHVEKQPGFISRESAAGDNGEWLVIVHWRSVEDAESSMASFSSAPATAQFMSKIDANTMNMKRYISK